MSRLVIGMVVSIIVILYGVYTMRREKSLLFGGNPKIYTEDSIQLFGQISGILEVMGGISVFAYAIGAISAVPAFVGWIAAALVWIISGLLVSAYMIIPSRI